MATATAFRALRVAALDRHTDDAAVVTFEVPDDVRSEFAFEPGQHLTVRHLDGDDEARRSYSICSPQGGPLRIGVRRLPGGRVSGWLCDDIEVGSTVEVLPPAGSFVLDRSDGTARRHVAIAAGSGITPVASIVGTVLADEPGSVVTLVTVNRTAASAMLLEELQALKDRWLGRLQLLFVLTREQTEVDLLSGRLDRARLDRLIEVGLVPVDADRYWLCGPEPLIAEITEVLAERGVAGDRIRHELFGAVSAAPSPARGAVGAQATVTLGGRTSTVAIAAGETVLDAVRRHRPDVPYSCTAGVCATCRAHLRDGTVDVGTVHGLAADELAAAFVLTCQAQPTSERLAVDFDA